MANLYDEDSDSAHQEAVRSSQFAVRRRPGIGPQPISEEAEDWVVEFLSRGHSPEQIAAVPGQYPMPAGHAWIYSKAGSRPAPWRAVVQASALLAARGGEAGSGKDLGGFIPNRVSISQRPQRANLRSRVGDWQGDPVVRRISKAVLLVLVERRSRLIKLERLSNRPATTVGKAICSLLKGHMVRVRVRSITADHGHGVRRSWDVVEEDQRAVLLC